MGIFLEALEAVSGRWKPIILASLLPFTMSALLEFLPLDASSFLFFLVVLAQLWLYTCIAVAVHRIVLIGPDSVPTFGVMLQVSRPQLRFAAFLLGVGILITILVILMKLVFFFSLFVLAALLYVVPVVSFAFPATAVDSDLAFRELLDTGRHHYWLLVKAVLIVPLVIGLVVNAIRSQSEAIAAVVPGTALEVGAQAGTALVLIVEITVLSMAYANIEQRESSAAMF